MTQTVDTRGHKTAGAWCRPTTTSSVEFRSEQKYTLVILLCTTWHVTGCDMLVRYWLFKEENVTECINLYKNAKLLILYKLNMTFCGACIMICRVSQEECAGLREGVPYVKVYRYNPKHLCLKLNGYADNGQRNLKILTAVTHLLITKYILKLAGICGFCLC